jgi:hypothetical protein
MVECRRTERAGEMARGEERSTRRDSGDYAVGIMRRQHGHWETEERAGGQVCPAQYPLSRTSPRSESSHPPPGGAIEWIVDMWEYFVILSWWGGGYLWHFGLWTTNWVREMSVSTGQRDLRGRRRTGSW